MRTSTSNRARKLLVSQMRASERLGELVHQVDFREWLQQRDGLISSDHAVVVARIVDYYYKADSYVALLNEWESRT